MEYSMDRILANSCCFLYLYKTCIELYISSYWLQLFIHKFRDGLVRSLKMETIF